MGADQYLRGRRTSTKSAATPTGTVIRTRSLLVFAAPYRIARCARWLAVAPQQYCGRAHRPLACRMGISWRDLLSDGMCQANKDAGSGFLCVIFQFCNKDHY